MYSLLDDTIAAIATSIGQSGIGIIKISGSNAYEIGQSLFVSAKGLTKFKAHHLHYGHIVDPSSQTIVDEVLIVYMPKPHSYTRQDMVEIHAHGGTIPLQRILELTFTLGARPAEAGEMTLRAFLNGRLDLAQAEAVLDVIEAKTDASLRVATEQLSGSLSHQVSTVRAALLDILAFLEASIDFVEDEIPYQDIITPLTTIATQLQQLIAQAEHGQIYRQGVRAAIVGRPNVGKSSLLNTLLRGERAIVTDIPGTTRDTLEEAANIGGIPLRLVDTAGIRAEPADEVERIGVERSRTALAQADIALLVIDCSRPLEPGDWEIEALVGQKPGLLIMNKSDLNPLSPQQLPLNFLSNAPRLLISALTGDGLAPLETAIVSLVTGGDVTLSDTPLVSNPRHKALLQQSLEQTQAAIAAQKQGLSPDLVSIDVYEAVDALGKITGETVTEDLLDTIFSKFCIGK
ncbi:MAG: tRNA uridine-5-carboxymethylaminomethyl(34) synthesis GTPase MnmE [Chloroflexota bacterium]